MFMRQILFFVCGMVAGALLLYAYASLRVSPEDELRRKLIDKLSQDVADLNQEPEVQYIEIEGKKGIVTVHTGMPKDSVQLLVGKPDEVSLDTYGGSSHEKWGYKIHNRLRLPKDMQIADLRIEFVDGRLDGVRQE